MASPAVQQDGRVRRRILVQGVVQGVGFRPFVYSTATELLLSGSVSNSSAGVVVEVEGAAAAVAAFERRLVEQPPPLAIIAAVDALDVRPCGDSGFTIGPSTPGAAGRTLASPDVATCRDCLRELADPTDRRHRHPFITCTACGPRFTIIESLPYDRTATTMARFPLCARCAREYADPADRRFHAQPIACHDCGPTLELVEAGGRRTRREAALAGARALLAGGGVLAVKGVGGYHLACDAANEEAVAELRRRKRRGAKPFAVMVGDLGTARRLTVTGPGLRGAAQRPAPSGRAAAAARRRGSPPRWHPRWPPATPTWGCCWPTRRCTCCCSGCPATARGPRCW